ncbi:hypothetical protein M2137_002425 [Parabacteroides sp. PFB2-10]|uniref:BF3164 family lipoprotein n=1 Tax=Parabacteroides sp. PFB2-10 TaxID=1742405 RepID=UPI002476A745|nr:BF3164 family lipoprotein [Parabacteroides sp. PFB2-10]MDH6313635.1 hypothetical protein [Parabacteroides sp. PFB2-10]MDL2245422.1 TolB-like 6-bladed beta-propeller domain-containing protein [Parabacteroides sp. OttesenSCG-928-J18]
MKQPIFFLLFLGFLGSCSPGEGNKSGKEIAFPEEIRLQAEAITLDTALFRYPYRISIVDDIAVVMDLHNIDHYLHAFSYPAWQHIASFGRRGEAPEEMLSAEAIRFFSADSLWTIDANKMEITRWRIDVAEGMAHREEEVAIDKTLIRALDFLPVETGFFIPDYSGEHRFHRIDRTGACQASYGTIPAHEQFADLARPALAQGWRSFMGYHPQGLVVMATQLGEVIEIYSDSGESQAIIKGKQGDPQLQIAEGRAIPQGIMGFSDLQVTDRHIYASFSGISFDEKIAALRRNEETETGCRMIYVFDLTGLPLRKYILDHPIEGFHVDESRGLLTAIDVNRDDPIIQFRLQKF